MYDDYRTPLDRQPIGDDPVGRRGEGPGIGLIVGIALAVIAAAGGWLWYRSRVVPAPEPRTGPAEPAVAEPAAAEPAVPLPDLDASDPLLRDWVARLSAHPQLAAWLVNDDLARRFVGAVVAVAEGTSPSSHVGFLAPADPFRVRSSGDRIYIDPAAFRRYDLATDVFVSIDERGAAETYRRIEPLLDEAYLEIGDPQRTFEQTLARAIGNLLAVPVPTAPVEVNAASVSYTWADRDLEGRTLAEKHLLRLGPENARRVQEKLEVLAKALELQLPS